MSQPGKQHITSSHTVAHAPAMRASFSVTSLLSGLISALMACESAANPTGDNSAVSSQLFIQASLAAPAVTGPKQRLATPKGHRVIVYGDSLSLVGLPGGWPRKLDQLLDDRGPNWIVINRAINGNGLLWRTHCFGEPALDRLRSDLVTTTSTDTLVLMAGVNDLIQPRLPKGFSTCFDPGKLDAQAIVSALKALRELAAVQGRIFLATIPPFGRSEFHSQPAEADRQVINGWIRANWLAANIIDLSSVLGSAGRDWELSIDFDSGDGLHPNEKGAAAIAAAVAERLR